MKTDKKGNYIDIRKKRRLRFVLICIVCILCFILSFNMGRFPIHPITVFQFFFSKLFSLPADFPEEVEIIIMNIRLPRILAALLIGTALSVSGAVFQALFKNPMVSPDILGATSGAGFGAALGLFLGFGYAKVSGLSFLIGLAAVFLTYLIGRQFRGDEILGLILSGIMVGSMFKAGISMVKLVADTENTLPAITYWLMGSMSGIGYEELKMLVFPVVIGLVPMLLLRWRMNVFAASEEEAVSLGVNLKALRIIAIVSSTLMTAAAVSVSGIIGWVGLVIPHLTRLIVGYDYKYLIPTSAVLGAAFLLMVDNLARSIYTMEIPIGILTSFIGVPFFLVFFLRGGRK